MDRILKPMRTLKPINVENQIKPNPVGEPQPLPSITTPQQAMIVFGFDDGYESDYTIAYPEMKARGLVGTSFINPARIGNEGRLTVTQIQEMYADGWDFQCHTYNHDRLPNLTDDEIRADMEKVNQFFSDIGLPTPDHHTYPGLAVNERVKNVVGEYRKTARNGGLETPHISLINTEYDNINFMRYACFEGHSMSTGRLNYLREQVRKIKSYRGFGSFLMHRLVEDETEAQDDYTGLREHFNIILDYIVESGVEVVTTDEMYHKILAYQNR